MSVGARVTWLVTLAGGLLYFAGTVSADITMTATPAVYRAGERFDIRCDLGEDAGTVEDIYSIAIGLSESGIGTEDKLLAGMSDQEQPQVIRSLKPRASASGVLNHTDVIETYLVMHMNYTTCADVSVYYCKMTIKTGIIVHAMGQTLNYTTAATTEACQQITLPPTTIATTTTVRENTKVNTGPTTSPHILAMVLWVIQFMFCV